MGKLPLVGLMLVCFWIADAQTTPSIYLSHLQSYIQSKPNDGLRVPSLACNVINDTLFRNLPYTFLQATTQLEKQFKKIDSLTVPEVSKQYAKALVCADFVYAAFSYRLLGDSLGINTDTVLHPQWNQRSLANCYEIGVNNYQAVYCGDRTDFYCRLVDSLLQMKTTAVSIAGVHTFPLVRIGSKDYIIDPYDPFVLSDSSTGRVISYSGVLNPNIKRVHVTRTKHLFGDTRELISRPLIQQKSKQQNPCDVAKYVKALADEYLRAKKTNTLTEVRLPDFSIVRPLIYNQRFMFALPLKTRPDGPLRQRKDLSKYYFPSPIG